MFSLNTVYFMIKNFSYKNIQCFVKLIMILFFFVISSAGYILTLKFLIIITIIETITYDSCWKIFWIDKKKIGITQINSHTHYHRTGQRIYRKEDNWNTFFKKKKRIILMNKIYFTNKQSVLKLPNQSETMNSADKLLRLKVFWCFLIWHILKD